VWLTQKHGIRSRRQWRKLHLGINAVAHEIVASDLTPDDVGGVCEIGRARYNPDALTRNREARRNRRFVHAPMRCAISPLRPAAGVLMDLQQ
jgi:hypothetical protein